MKLTQDRIQQAAENKDVFSAGKTLYEQEKTDISKIDSFWKNEVYITASVHETDTAGKESVYRTRIFLKNDAVDNCLCSCRKQEAKGRLCRHGVAAALAYLEQIRGQGQRPAVTSPQIRRMLDGYLNREKSRILSEENSTPLRLFPCLSVRNGQCFLSLKTDAAGRQYPVRELHAFARAVETGAWLSYGKNAGFYHGIDAFAPDSRELVRMVRTMIQEEQQHSGPVHGRSTERRPKNGAGPDELPVGRSRIDAFLRLFTDRQLEIENTKGGTAAYTVREADPALKVMIGLLPGNGAAVWLETGGKSGGPEMFSSWRRIFLVSEEERILYCCSEAYSGDMYIFLDSLLNRSEAERQEDLRLAALSGLAGRRDNGCSFIGKRELPAFLARVLPVLQRHCQVVPAAGQTQPGHALAALIPAPLEASFSIDSPGPNVLTLSVTYRYGEISFSPLDQKHPALSYRDEAGELKISHILKRYFKERYFGTNQFVIKEDAEGLYLFLSEGLRRLKAEGKTELSPAAAALAIRPMPPVQVNLTLKGKWLQLEVDLEGLNPEDIRNILTRYEQKKPYYQKKDGTFLSVSQENVHTLWALYQGAEDSAAAGRSFMLPAGRLWYVNWLLAQDHRAVKTTDDYVDRLFDALNHGTEQPQGMKHNSENSDKHLPVPDSFAHILRPYQQTGFHWLVSLDRLGFGGILADDMGLGKTIQILALLVSEKERNPDEHSQSLVVCPSSLVFNWEQECRRFAPSLNVAAVTGNSQNRQDLLEQAGDFDLLITSYDLLKRDALLYRSFRFRYQIIDEAQYIKNKKTQCAKAVKSVFSVTRFALTGTPVENRLGELWSIFDYLMPGFLFTYGRFKELFENPLTREESGEALSRLLALTQPFILRRLKKDVLTELPDKMETVVYTPLEGEQKKLYTAAAFRLKTALEQEEETQIQTNRFRILAQLTRLRQICCDPSLYYENYKGESAKLSACLELMESAMAGGHRLLVFSQFASMLNIIEGKLKELDIPYYMLTGDTSAEDRARMTAGFGQDEVQVFLISLKAGGVGLNLAAADVVIHYDPWWNAAAQNQATDRAHRLGQKNTVMVYKMIAKDTIEENILKLQAAKQRLAEQVIGARETAGPPLSKNELLQMLEIQEDML